MKSLRVIFGIIFMAGLLVGRLYAQDIGKKVAYVDLSKLFDEYQKTKEYDETLTAKQKVKEEERNKKIAEIKDLQSKLPLLNDKEKEKVQAQLDTKMKALQQFDQEATADLRKQRDDLVKEILKDIEKVISEYAQKEKYDLIFNDRILLYGEDSLNISAPLLKTLNDKYKKK
ncbi:MAG: OmpH family outer membrane protein [Candidatus Omnitrophota bacterium]|nr:OmpH family outer membrane protein [Candidatus Omnitrophota bacterium]